MRYIIGIWIYILVFYFYITGIWIYIPVCYFLQCSYHHWLNIFNTLVMVVSIPYVNASHQQWLFHIGTNFPLKLFYFYITGIWIYIPVCYFLQCSYHHWLNIFNTLVMVVSIPYVNASHQQWLFHIGTNFPLKLSSSPIFYLSKYVVGSMIRIKYCI